MTMTFLPETVVPPPRSGTDNYSDVPPNLPCNHNQDGTPCNLCSEIEDIQSQIQACQDLHPQLEELHETLRSLRAKRNDISPVSKLPTEIVSYIFVLCLPLIEREFLADYEPPCSEFYTPRLPSKLSRVCGSWRRIAHSISQLWSTLMIDIYQANLNQEDPSPDHQRHSLDVVALVKQNLHRMSFLCLNIPCQFIKTFFSRDSSMPDTLPILEELHFHCSVIGRRGICMKPHNFVLSIDPPSPKKVHVTSLSITGIRLKWNNVRHLCLEATTAGPSGMVQAALTLLSECKRLHVVDLVFYPDPILPPTEIKIIQNSIRNLRLFHTSPHVLSNITMPYLESLTLWQSNCHPPDPLVSFLQRSAPLKTMVWKPCGNTPGPAFIEVFQHTPKLQQLSLDLTDINPYLGRYVALFLEHLTRVVPSLDAASAAPPHNQSRGAFLPLLQKFVYSGKTIHFPLHFLLDIAEARSGPFPASEDGQLTRALEELSVYFLPHDDEKLVPPTGTDLQRILRLNAGGQKILVLEHDESCDMVTTDFSACYRDD